jgi:transcriptional regulator with XRE-family HTH domain
VIVLALCHKRKVTSPAKCLQAFLLATGWTESRLAAEAGVDRTTICKVRIGQRKSFSKEAARRLSALSPKLPFEVMLGMKAPSKRRAR